MRGVGRGIAVQADHLVADAVGKLVERIRAEQGRLDVLVNDLWGGEKLTEWHKPVWEHDLHNGLRLLRLGIETHLITAQTPRFVGRAVAALAADLERARWNGQALSSGQLAQVYGFTDLDGSCPDAWRYMRQVVEAGKAADAIGYR